MMYSLTFMDWITLSVIATIILIIYLMWPGKEEDIDIRESVLILGVNAIRLDWDPKYNKHKFVINCKRAADRLPAVGDLMRVVEVNNESWMGRVVAVNEFDNTSELVVKRWGEVA